MITIRWKNHCAEPKGFLFSLLLERLIYFYALFPPIPVCIHITSRLICVPHILATHTNVTLTSLSNWYHHTLLSHRYIPYITLTHVLLSLHSHKDITHTSLLHRYHPYLTLSQVSPILHVHTDITQTSLSHMYQLLLSLTQVSSIPHFYIVINLTKIAQT